MLENRSHHKARGTRRFRYHSPDFVSFAFFVAQTSERLIVGNSHG
jgi:hypothetical protein